MVTTTIIKNTEFELVFTRVYKRIKTVLASSNIDLMTKCEIYHIARSVKDTRERRAKFGASTVMDKQSIKELSRAEKAVNLIIKE